MMTGYRGTFVISWAQTELDGLAGAPETALSVGATWRWSGRAMRLDGPDDVLVLAPAEEMKQLRARAARAVRRVMGAVLEPDRLERVPAPLGPVLDTGFAVTDGLKSYTATLIARGPAQQPLLVFLDEVPPERHDLWVTHIAEGRSRTHRTGDALSGVICFTPETRIATPDGTRAVGELAEGDRILTKDDGPQRILWTGQRRLSGAALRALPDLRPIRVRAGAAGIGVPDADLLISPQHRLLVQGPMAEALFHSKEVLVEARDLVNDATITVDHQLGEVTYVHLMLERHQIVFANGLETESFHPAGMALDTVAPDQRDALSERVPGVEDDPSVYGAYARRMLTRAEAALLSYGVTSRH